MGRRSKEQVPKMRHDKQRGRAYVRIDGVRHRLGKWGSDKAQASYDALIASWLVSGRDNTDGATAAEAQPAPLPSSSGILTVADLLALWMQDIATNGKGIKSSSYGSARAAGRAMSAFLTLPVADFGPKAFKQVMRDYAKTPVVTRKKLKDGTVVNVERPRTRKYVNSVMVRIRKMFEWAVSEELIADATKAWRLQSVPLLEYGDPHTKESDERTPAKPEVVQATLGALTRECASLIEVLSLTGARPGEICKMTMEQIYDREKKVWRYVPKRHKNSWRGKIRHVAIGPRSQEIINRQVEEYGLSETDAIFSPRRSIPRKREGAKPDPRAREFFESLIVRKAVCRACEVAGVEHWFPYQMRYAAGAKARQQGGIATTSATLGNSKKVAAHYAPEGFERAEAFAEANG